MSLLRHSKACEESPFAFLAIKDIKKGDPSDLRPQDDKGQPNGVILSISEESPTFLSSSILKRR